LSGRKRSPADPAPQKAGGAPVDDDLEALFEDALKSMSRAPKAAKADDESMAIEVDRTMELTDDIDQLLRTLGDIEAPKRRAKQAKAQKPPTPEDDQGALDDLLASLPDLSAASFGREARPFDDADRELQEAMMGEDGSSELDLDREIERMLAESLGPSVVPSIHDEAGDEEILAASDDGSGATVLSPSDEIAMLRAQHGEMAKVLSLRDLELRTAEERVEQLEQQTVASARQAAAVSREFEAFRKRADRERDDLKKFAAERVLKEFLTIHDNLGRALGHSVTAEGDALREGVDMILGQLSSALRRCGVEPVASNPGDLFDPAIHEAVGQEWSEEHDPGTVLAEMGSGFLLNGRLLRAAMVVVSRGRKPTDGEVAIPTPPSDETADGEAPSEEIPDAEEAAGA
jgi:molecular chaperone GrpE